MSTNLPPNVVSFNADEVITILMALDAAMMLAELAENHEEHEAARSLRAKLVKTVATGMAMEQKQRSTVQ